MVKITTGMQGRKKSNPAILKDKTLLKIIRIKRNSKCNIMNPWLKLI